VLEDDSVDDRGRTSILSERDRMICLQQEDWIRKFKHAVVTPRLKQPDLAPDDMKNYRPISQLPFFP